tara:strand:+ start:449 stop:658 length:210 start_codon:yes stop_codon:yes gene_type:complete
MKIKVNGKEKYLNIEKRKLSLLDTIIFLGYKPNMVVVELNNLIVNYEGLGDSDVEDGDRLEIVSIVGGG